MPKSRKSLLLILALAVAAAVAFVYLKPAATNAQRKSAAQQRQLENYDIRSDKNAADKIAAFRGRAGRVPEHVAGIRDRHEHGVEPPKQRVPRLKVDYDEQMHVPEVIGPDVREAKTFLTKPSTAKRRDVLKGFLKDNSNAIGLSASEIANLKTAADYADPDGKLGFVRLEQAVNGVPVFRGEVRAGFTKNGELVRVVNGLVPGLADATIPSDFSDADAATRAASSFVDGEIKKVTADKIYFPTEAGVVVPAWAVQVWEKTNAYYVIVDANSGTMLWRKCMSEDQSQANVFSVYANPNAMINVAQSPFLITPGPT